MPDRDRDRLLGVYEDPERAERAAQRAREAGADPDGIDVGNPRDEVASLQTEMREEAEQSVVSPQAALLATKETNKSLGLLVPLATLGGAILALPLGLIEVGGLSMWARMLAAAVVGATAGATLGFVLGGGLGAKGPAKRLAAERGVTVNVADTRDEVARALAAQQPIRLDEVGPDGSSRALTTEEARTDYGVVEGLEKKIDDPEGDWDERLEPSSRRRRRPPGGTRQRRLEDGGAPRAAGGRGSGR